MAGTPITTSSPVVVDNGGNPFIVAGDMGGNLGAFDLDTGTPVAGWSGRRSGFVVRAPLSTDGSNVYVPVAQDGKDRYPQYRKFSASGSEIWRSNHSTAIPSNPSTGFLLSGVSLARIGGAWTGFTGSSGHWIYGINASNGARLWSFRNADSTMATPAVADVYGTGTPQIITSNDTSREFPGDRHGGILRILTHDGRQICTATQLVSGDRYAASGYNNSSPVVAEVGGRPLIAFGSTGPAQHGDGGNQVVAYDHACRLRWASPPLAAQAAPSPSIADTRGTGGLQVIQVVGIRNGASTYPRVYVLDATNGRIISDTGSRLQSYGASLAYPSSLSITTADLNGDGAQDLLVPARQGSFVLLNGPDLSVIGTINTNMVIQNTPVVTAEAGGVRVSMAGYNASGGVVSSWVASGPTLGARGWHTFAHNAQRTGLMGKLSGPDDQLVEGQSLRPGETMRSLNDVYRMTMQTDGNLVIRRRIDGAVKWASGTRSPGSSLILFQDGNLVVRASNGKFLWQSKTRGAGTERVQLSDDGTLRVYTSTSNGTRLLSSARMLWRSDTGLVK
ncbi:MAG TPA: hypothetical protein VL068_08590 [Microthrixaceae bacterium]|nr:hypothetical protein [Microthrixaceae bacterium]